MDRGSRRRCAFPILLQLLLGGLGLVGFSGCATMRTYAPSADLRPCSDEFIETADHWNLGVRHLRPASPDPNKLPVILCHGMGLNGTFWTITDNNTLPKQLLADGYEVFIFDIRGSGESTKAGLPAFLNRGIRQTPLLEYGEGKWTVDDIVRFDVPAILGHVQRKTGKDQVNWVGHSLGGMLLFAYLETSKEPWRIANFVAMGSTIILAHAPERDLLKANRQLSKLAALASPGRLGRPLTFIRLPFLAKIDRFYYSAENVDKLTVSRFYGYTLEDTGRGALKQLDPYLEFGHFISADRKIDYAARLNEVKTPILLIAGDGDVRSDVPSTKLTQDALGSLDKTLLCFGKAEGHFADYGHCDLVWSRHAPNEIFPPILHWLDSRQPGAAFASEQTRDAVKPSSQENGPVYPLSFPELDTPTAPPSAP